MSSQDAGGMALPILQGPTKHKDPVCGMMVVPEKAAAKVARAGKTYYFCSKSCADRFSREPGKFVSVAETVGIGHRPPPAEHRPMQPAGAAASRPALAEEMARYSCAMQPEIIRKGAGNCPIY